MLHANWSDGRLVVWAESIRRFLLLSDSQAAPALPTGDEISEHPFATPPDELRELLGEQIPAVRNLLGDDDALIEACLSSDERTDRFDRTEGWALEPLRAVRRYEALVDSAIASRESLLQDYFARKRKLETGGKKEDERQFKFEQACRAVNPPVPTYHDALTGNAGPMPPWTHHRSS